MKSHYSLGMTETSKAPTDAEIMRAHAQAEADRAMMMAAHATYDRLTRNGRSLAQAKRSSLVNLALILRYSPRPTDTKASLLAVINERMA